MFFHLLPPIYAKETKEEKPKKRPRTGGKPRYNHFQMISDKLNGLSWSEVAKKHGVKSSSACSNICLRSAAMKKLTPKEIEQMDLRTH